MIGYDVLRDKTQKERVSIAAELYHRDELAECERVLSFILDRDAHNPAAIATLGAMYVHQDRYGMAEMVYRYGVALYPSMKSMWIGLGTSIRNPERKDECIQILSDVIEADPDNTVAITNLASMYSETGEYEKAAELAKRSIELKGDKADSYAATDCLALVVMTSASILILVSSVIGLKPNFTNSSKFFLMF